MTWDARRKDSAVLGVVISTRTNVCAPPFHLASSQAFSAQPSRYGDHQTARQPCLLHMGNWRLMELGCGRIKKKNRENGYKNSIFYMLQRIYTESQLNSVILWHGWDSREAWFPKFWGGGIRKGDTRIQFLIWYRVYEINFSIIGQHLLKFFFFRGKVMGPP